MFKHGLWAREALSATDGDPHQPPHPHLDLSASNTESINLMEVAIN